MEDIQLIIRLIKNFNLNKESDINKLSHFPREVSLGDLNADYFAFINALQQLENYQKENLFAKQKEILNQLIEKQKEVYEAFKEKSQISTDNMALIKKFHVRDSILLSKHVLSNADFDKSEMNFLNVKDTYQNILKDMTLNSQQIQETENKLQQAIIQEHEKQKQMHLELSSSYITLSDNLKIWEQKYVFKLPMDGQVQFLNFWINNQFVQSGEAVFTIVSHENKMTGQISLPSFGAGKVKTGQEVILKLENYPYSEYGTVKGKVRSISLTANLIKTQNGVMWSKIVGINLQKKY